MKALIKSILGRRAPRLLYNYQIYLRGKEEPEIRLLRQFCRKDAISIDVGANLGLYAYHMLPHSARVMAFEPLSELHQRLTEHYGDRISVFPVALSDHCGECEIRFPLGNTCWATIEAENTLPLAGDIRIHAYRVPLRRLDDYKFEKVGLMKIDVEGHEEAVLQGGLQTIAAQKPTLIIEIEERHKAGAIDRVATLLTGLGYKGYFFDKAKMKPLEQFNIQFDQPITNIGPEGKSGRYINNFVFLSRS